MVSNKPAPLHPRSALLVGPEEGAAYEAAVDRGHAAYCAALRSLFEQHREHYAKGEAGLQLVE